MKNTVFIMACLCLALGAQAQQPIESASADDLVNQLAPPEELTRSLRNLAPQPRQVDLMVQFDFDSARLQEASKPLLNNLAKAMHSDRLKTVRFRVEGHTDGVGSAAYNLQLSQRRAQSVLDFLVQKGVAPSRLLALGKGATELLDPNRVDAIENRRVRVSTLN